MINNVTLVGRLVNGIELRYTGTGQDIAIANFRIVVNRRFKNAAGEREADFINCVLWRKQAENLANWAKKGALIGVVGSIQTRDFENRQGQKVYVAEVVVENFQLLESRAIREKRGMPNTSQTNSPIESDPFANGTPLDIGPEDLPF